MTINHDVTIRRLVSADHDALLRVWAVAGLPYKPFGRDSRENLSIEMDRTETGFLGAFVDDRLVGVVLATWDGRKGWINRLAIDPDFRSHGIGERLIREAEAFLESLGAAIIACLIEEHNLPSMSLFQKTGYIYHPEVYYFSKRKSDAT
jgi:N-acetylglutamate synthase